MKSSLKDRLHWAGIGLKQLTADNRRLLEEVRVLLEQIDAKDNSALRESLRRSL